MKRVYLVSCFYHNEGHSNLALYDSLEKAKTWGKKKYDDYVHEVTAVSCNMNIQEFEIM